MKLLRVFVCALSILCVCVLPVFADDPVSDPAPAASSQQEEVIVVRDLMEPVEPAEGTLPGLVNNVFGTYTPRTQRVTVYLPDGNTVITTEPVSGVAGMDWYWIAGVVLFSFVLWSFFRVLGVVIKRG